MRLNHAAFTTLIVSIATGLAAQAQTCTSNCQTNYNSAITEITNNKNLCKQNVSSIYNECSYQADDWERECADRASRNQVYGMACYAALALFRQECNFNKFIGDQTCEIDYNNNYLLLTQIKDNCIATCNGTEEMSNFGLLTSAHLTGAKKALCVRPRKVIRLWQDPVVRTTSSGSLLLFGI